MMFDLYQISFGHQPHFVVATSFGDAEREAKAKGYILERIECLGPYILVTSDAIKAINEDD